MITIDGSYGEGGGQIIRTSLSLAALTGKAVEIVNVRARRTRPGLQPQHLTAVRAAAQVCAATLEGDAVGATRLAFTPASPPCAGRYRFDIRTAGATTLVAQTVLLPLAHAEGSSQVTVIGGTHVPHAPVAEYLEWAYLPALRAAGIEAEFEYPQAGFYPRGGGEIQVKVRSAPPIPLHYTERGRLTALTAIVLTGALPEHVRERGAATVERFMKGVGRTVTVERRDRAAASPGAAVVIVAECEGGRAAFTGMGERGKPMERVAEEACQEFMVWWKSGAACDEHLADQLVLPAALAAGESRWTTPKVTEHLRTVAWVAQQFLPVRVAIDEDEAGRGTVVLCGAPADAGSSTATG